MANVDAPVSSISCSAAVKVGLRTVFAAAPDGDRGVVGVPTPPPSGLVAAPMGESGWVGGLSETVAFGRAPVLSGDPAGAVGVRDPSGALAVLRGIVGAPIGEFVVANFIVGVPVGVGTSGFVVVPERGMVGAPALVTGLWIAAAVGVSGMVGVPVGASDLIGTPEGAPPGAAVLIGMVGAGTGAFGAGGAPGAVAGAFGGPAIGAVVAAVTGGRGGVDKGVATGIEEVGGGVTA